MEAVNEIIPEADIGFAVCVSVPSCDRRVSIGLSGVYNFSVVIIESSLMNGRVGGPAQERG